MGCHALFIFWCSDYNYNLGRHEDEVKDLVAKHIRVELLAVDQPECQQGS